MKRVVWTEPADKFTKGKSGKKMEGAIRWNEGIKRTMKTKGKEL